MTREEILKLVDDEITHQMRHFGSTNKKDSIGDLLTRIDYHLSRSKDTYANDARDILALSDVRKIAALAIYCLEKHYCK